MWAGRRRWHQHRHYDRVHHLPTIVAEPDDGDLEVATRERTTQTDHFPKKKHDLGSRLAYPCTIHGTGDLDEKQEDRPGGQYTLRIRKGETQFIASSEVELEMAEVEMCSPRNNPTV